ncbi:MAG: hypothetical protein FJ038_00750 [Chloroflexi bacterium]|nr:hypothetical protein [Chloroflexota bacterium]
MADLRKCIGSAKFGIEAHEAPAADFPVQPSQKDGLGRMCKVHWNAYTAGLARDAKIGKAADAANAARAATGIEVISRSDDGFEGVIRPGPTKAKRGGRKAAVPAAGAQGDAG